MKIKTSELTDAALDWAVGFALTLRAVDGRVILARDLMKKAIENGLCPYSSDWAQGGPIIEREVITVEFILEWSADIHGEHPMDGETPLIAAMRCYVASKLGDEAEIPDELTGAPTNQRITS